MFRISKYIPPRIGPRGDIVSYGVVEISKGSEKVVVRMDVPHGKKATAETEDLMSSVYSALKAGFSQLTDVIVEN